MTPALAIDPFAPLSPMDVELMSSDAVDGDPQLSPVVPVPADAPPAQFRHRQLGEPSATWSYRDEVGRLLGHVARFETPSGKAILPRAWCRLPDGSGQWRWKSFAAPRPLYGLDRLAQRLEAPVLIVEGEKTADSARARFIDHVAITWPGGSNAIAKADWSVLADRHVIIWPDADEPGRKAAEQVAKLAIEAGARSVSLVSVPSDLPEGWDLADEIPDGIDLDALLASAREVVREAEFPFGYVMTDAGLVWRNPDDEEKPDLLVAGTFRVLAETRDSEGTSWGVLLEWNDHDGRVHRLALPRSTLAGDGADARRILLDGGLYVAANRSAKERLTGFLLAVRSGARVTATSRIGWHGSAFVLPDQCIGTSGDQVILQGSSAFEHPFREKGTLDEWQNDIARYAVGNSRLAVAISTAFAAALVGPCGAESGGLHFRGPSSIGKSTALLVAGSVWGGGGPSGFVRSWRATANGLEGVALGYCDALLCLDEIAQIAAREAGEVAYMLANGAGKSRSGRDGSARRAAQWRLLFLSSGEIGLADKVAEDGRGKRLSAGQQVRIVDVPADAGAGLGLFEALLGFPSAEALARHLRSAVSAHYGTAARMFLAAVADDLDRIHDAIADHTRDFVKSHVQDNADGQVHRVAQRFALIAAAGEIAVTAGVLPWPAGEATRAAAKVFCDWLDVRGGIGPAEIRIGIEQIRAFLLANGMSRFVPAWEEASDPRIQPREIAGFRKREADNNWDFFVTTDAWRAEVCAGIDGRALARQLAERGLLIVPESGGRHSKPINVPSYGKLRLYHLPARFLAEDSGND